MTPEELQALMDDTRCLAACLTYKQLLAAGVIGFSTYSPTPPGPPEPTSPLTVPNAWAFHRSDTGLSNDGVNVTGTSNVWSDLTGLGHHFETINGSQPGYTASGPNSKPAVKYGQLTTKYIEHHLNASGNITVQPFAFFGLVKALSWVDNGYIWGTNQNAARGLLAQSGSALLIKQFAGNFSVGISLPLNTWTIISSIINGPASKLQLNNAAEVTQSPGLLATPGGLILGNNQVGGSFSCEMEVAAIVVVNGLPDAAARTIIKNWLAWYGGITL